MAEASSLWVYQARYRMPIAKAVAGNIVLIEGVDATITKTATLVAEGYEEEVHIFRCVRPCSGVGDRGGRFLGTRAFWADREAWDPPWVGWVGWGGEGGVGRGGSEQCFEHTFGVPSGEVTMFEQQGKLQMGFVTVLQC